jgi:hypothetical protein
VWRGARVVFPLSLQTPADMPLTLMSKNPFLVPLSSPLYPSPHPFSFPLSILSAQTRQLIGCSPSALITIPTHRTPTATSASREMSSGSEERGLADGGLNA